MDKEKQNEEKRQVTTIVEFFNPYALKHIKAWIFLQKNGTWPVGFYPEIELEYVPMWYLQICAKIANVYIEMLKNNKIIGMPGFESPDSENWEPEPEELLRK